MARLASVMTNAVVHSIAVRLGNTSAASVACLSCGDHMNLFRPDPHHPQRLLGTCNQCHDWYLWDFADGSDVAIITLLPNADYFRDTALGQDEGEQS